MGQKPISAFQRQYMCVREDLPNVVWDTKHTSETVWEQDIVSLWAETCARLALGWKESS